VVNLWILLAICAAVYVFTRMMGNPIGHSSAFMRRRALNWVPLGIAYALLNMGRYNLTIAKIAFGDVMTKSDFGAIFAAGTVAYAFAFVLNGPLTDKIGGRKAMLLAAGGAGVANALMGLVTYLGPGSHLLVTFILLYSLNMYFQSFGAVAIVKVNSHWFHVRERGMFGGIFGILISTGTFFAFQVGQLIVDVFHTAVLPDGAVKVSPPFWVFWIPSLLLFAFVVIIYFLVHDTPSKTGHSDFDTGDASSGEDLKPDPLPVILKKVLTNPIVLTIGAIEFCTGILRHGVMQWYPILAKDVGYYSSFFMTRNWGAMQFLAGATGGMTAGWISDKVFGSRRGPVAALLYGLMFISCLVMVFTINRPWALGACVFVISYCVIGTHGMLSGTASMDFGGRKNVGTAVGLIDGLVYLGAGLQALCQGYLAEGGKGWSFGGYFTDAQKGWSLWPVFLLPFSLIGFFLAVRIWKALPEATRRGSH
jgi:OPA family glycerol-3-phosphate transporter-like MFS transporter